MFSHFHGLIACWMCSCLLAQMLEQRLRCLEVLSGETLSKSDIDRSERFDRFTGKTLALSEPGEAYGGAQCKRRRAAMARPGGGGGRGRRGGPRARGGAGRPGGRGGGT